MTDAPPSLEPDLVHTFVANAHADLDAVRGALAEEPRLANAAWDWGGGDWETGLGAAAHMRMALGPHGIPLLAHAEAGGERAAGVVALLSA